MTTQVPPAWFPDEFAISTAKSFLTSELELIDIEPLRAVLMRRTPRVSLGDEDLYADALYDLIKLLEEYRYLSAVGVLYATSVEDEIQAIAEAQSKGPGSVGMSSAVRALLAGMGAANGDPSTHLKTPGITIPGLRVLGGWWAAMLYDSALIRGMAIMDRIAALLAIESGQQIKPDWMPIFRTKFLDKLPSWQHTPEMAQLHELASGKLFEFVKSYRDGFVHKQRVPVELHGDHRRGGWRPDGTTSMVPGISAYEHAGLVSMFYNDVISVACDAAGHLISPDYEPERDDVQ